MNNCMSQEVREIKSEDPSTFKLTRRHISQDETVSSVRKVLDAAQYTGSAIGFREPDD